MAVAGSAKADTMILTSSNAPLCIAEVATPAAGKLGLTFCPGKRDPAALSGHWHRDLEADLQVIIRWGASMLVTVMEPWELEHLQVPALGRRATELGLEWMQLALVDGGTPDCAAEKTWRPKLADLTSRLCAGERLVVHCRGGLGRTGLVAARLLIELGESPAEALARVRRERPGAVETRAQEAYLLRRAWTRCPE